MQVLFVLDIHIYMSEITVDYLEQINPIAETADSQLVAADAKLNFDDNAAYRHKDIFALHDTTQDDAREVYFCFFPFFFKKKCFTWESNT